MPLPPFLNSIVGWLRAGYPAGVPDNDYVALIALLSRRLTSEEVTAVAAELGRQAQPEANGSAGPDNGAEPVNGAGPVNGAEPNGLEASAAGANGPEGQGELTVNNTDIGVLITKITNELPREEDVARVRSRLAAAGPFL